jgi:hypothetical protein
MSCILGLETPTAFTLPEMRTCLPRAGVGSIAAKKKEE